MKLTNDTTDRATLTELGARLARLRLDLNRTQAELARDAGVSKRTLERIEGGSSVQLSNLIRVLRALRLLERLDVVVPEAKTTPMERIRSKSQRRQRASSRSDDASSGPWEWGDEG